MFWQKFHGDFFSKTIDKNFDVSFSWIFLCVLSRFRVFLSDGSSKALQKTFCKQIVSKVFTKNSTKNPKPIFLYFSISLGFVGEESSKTQHGNTGK
jgi:hypothetical protein